MRHKASPFNQHGFTLAELLVVITIIGLMFAIALPALNNLTNQSKLGAAATALHAATQKARQYAVANNQPTYLVFDTGQNAPEMAFRSYRTFTIDIHTPPVSQSDGYFIDNWASLPVGVYFDDLSKPQDNLFIPNVADSWNGAISENGRLKIQNKMYSVIGFSPQGKTSSKRSWNRSIILAEGVRNATTFSRTSTAGKDIRLSLNGDAQIFDLLYEDASEPEDLQL